MNQMDKYLSIRLEGRRNILLLEREETWRLKSWATWLECGDDNTQFFMLMLEGGKQLTLSRFYWMIME